MDLHNGHVDFTGLFTLMCKVLENGSAKADSGPSKTLEAKNPGGRALGTSRFQSSALHFHSHAVKSHKECIMRKNAGVMQELWN